MNKNENRFRLTLPQEVRQTTRLVFTSILGCTVQNPSENIDVYVFNDTVFIGICYANDKENCTLETWKEVHINEVGEVLSMLQPLGVKQINYGGPVGPCFQSADGSVFRFVA